MRVMLDIDGVLAELTDEPRAHNYWLGLHPYIDSVRAVAIHRLYYPNDEIFYITARYGVPGLPTMHQTQIWLASVGIAGLGTNVIVSEKPDKSDIINALDLDASLDDNLEAVTEHTRKTRGAFLLDREWNREGRQGVKVVQSVAEFFRAARRVVVQ